MRDSFSCNIYKLSQDKGVSMKHTTSLSILFTAILLLPTCFALAQELPVIDHEEQLRARKTEQEPLDEQTKEIVGEFAKVVNGFLTLVQDPNNKHHVAKSITQMIASATQLVIAATKSLHHESFDGEAQETAASL